jgi:hypothetical protein
MPRDILRAVDHEPGMKNPSGRSHPSVGRQSRDHEPGGAAPAAPGARMARHAGDPEGPRARSGVPRPMTVRYVHPAHWRRRGKPSLEALLPQLFDSWTVSIRCGPDPSERSPTNRRGRGRTGLAGDNRHHRRGEHDPHYLPIFAGSTRARTTTPRHGSAAEAVPQLAHLSGSDSED